MAIFALPIEFTDTNVDNVALDVSGFSVTLEQAKEESEFTLLSLATTCSFPRTSTDFPLCLIVAAGSFYSRLEGHLNGRAVLY